MNPGATRETSEPSTLIDVDSSGQGAEQSTQTICMDLALGPWCGTTARGHATTPINFVVDNLLNLMLRIFERRGQPRKTDPSLLLGQRRLFVMTTDSKVFPKLGIHSI
jgi:hypothetical protein